VNEFEIFLNPCNEMVLESSFDYLIVSNRGNPRVFFLYPYPTPPNTLPLREGKGYPSDKWRVR
jgi:hypothetical protein